MPTCNTKAESAVELAVMEYQMEISEGESAPLRITDEWLKEQHGQRTCSTREELDRKGLMVRISVLGRIEFVARYVLPPSMRSPSISSRQELTLGAFPTMGIEQARLDRDTITEELRRGIDPQVSRSSVDPYQRHIESVEDLFWEWFDSLPASDFSRGTAVIAEYQQHVFHSLGKRQPASVTEEEWLDVTMNAFLESRDLALRLWIGITGAMSLAGSDGVGKRNVVAGLRFRHVLDYIEDKLEAEMEAGSELSVDRKRALQYLSNRR